jgi:hypothetical protein
MALILDVARFKYSPYVSSNQSYKLAPLGFVLSTHSILLHLRTVSFFAVKWVKVNDLYEAMKPVDPATSKPRGWCLVYPQPSTVRDTGERRRPGELVASSSFNATRKKIIGKKKSVDDSGCSQHPEAQQQQAFPSKQTSGICPVTEIKVEYCPTKIKGGQAAWE